MSPSQTEEMPRPSSSDSLDIPDSSWQALTASDLYNHLGQELVRLDLLSNEACARAKSLAHQRDAGFVSVLVSLGMVSEQALADAIAQVFDIPRLSKDDLADGMDWTSQISNRFLKANHIAPIAETASDFAVAMADPLDDFVRASLEMLFSKPIRIGVATASDIDESLDQRELPGDAVEIDGNTALADEHSHSIKDDIARLEDLASGAPVIRYVNTLLRNAVDARASDIHIEPQEAGIGVRFRIDGVLRPIRSETRVPNQDAIVSRIKILARLDIAEHRLPQDGSARVAIRGRQIDLRISTLPATHGESAVIRILDRSSGVKSLESLGLSDNDFSRLSGLLDQPNGIVLVTGPTGSGKTTTLYAALQKLMGPDRKIITVEDPVEYQIEGLTQIQVKPQIDLSFAKVLRSVLRHDPDIVMIGEIRDLETARIAVQASLTGHLVLSTLHTNSAIAAVARLLEMGVEPYLLAATLNGVLAQRLVRRLCPDCKKPVERMASVAQGLLAQHGISDGAKALYEAGGCETCDETGYRERQCISEVFVVNTECRRLISEGGSEQSVDDVARAHGMTSLVESGLSLVAAGETSALDILRVVQSDYG